MKRIEKLRPFYLTAILLLFISLSSYGQDRKDKTTAIINKFHFVEHQKRKFEIQLEPLKYQVQGSDSIKLLDLEKQLTDEEITKRVCAAFYEVFNDDEINDIYNFMQTNAYRKLSSSGEIFKAVSNRFSEFDKEIERITNNLGELRKEPIWYFEPTPVDREDGFYFTTELSDASTDKEAKLEETPSFTSKDILEVNLIKHNGNNLSEIAIQFTKEGSQKYYLLTKENIRKPIALVIAKRIVSMPTINTAISDGKFSVVGDFSEKEIDEMVGRLRNK